MKQRKLRWEINYREAEKKEKMGKKERKSHVHMGEKNLKRKERNEDFCLKTKEVIGQADSRRKFGWQHTGGASDFREGCFESGREVSLISFSTKGLLQPPSASSWIKSSALQHL